MSAAPPHSKEETLLNFVVSTARKGDAVDVLAKMDEFGWKHEWLMALGDNKSLIVKKALALAEVR